MILSPYALLLLALVLCSEVVGHKPRGHKKHKEPNAEGQHLDRAPPTPGQWLATITGIPLLAGRQASLEDLMKLEEEHKFVNELSSEVWPPKVGGVYFTELRNMGLPNYNTPHPVVVMGPADPMFTTTEECVLVLEISHNMPMADKYQTPVKELFPEGTKISVDPIKSGDLDGSVINSAAYRIVQANKFVLLPPVNIAEFVVMSKDDVEMLKTRVAKSDYPEKKKFYPDWVLSNKKEVYPESFISSKQGKWKPPPPILLYIHRRMDLLKYLLGIKGEPST